MRYTPLIATILLLTLLTPVVVAEEETALMVIDVTVDLYRDREVQEDKYATVNLTIILPADPQAIAPPSSSGWTSGDVLVMVSDFKVGPGLPLTSAGEITIDSITLVRSDTGVPVIIIGGFIIYHINIAVVEHHFPSYSIVYLGSDLDKAWRRLTVGKIYASYRSSYSSYPLEVVVISVSTRIVGVGDETATETVTKTLTVTQTVTQSVTTARTVTVPREVTKTVTVSAQSGEAVTKTVVSPVTVTETVVSLVPITATDTEALAKIVAVAGEASADSIYNLVAVLTTLTTLVLALIALAMALRYRKYQ